MEKKELRVDRIEGDIVVAFDNDGQEYTFATEGTNIRENDIILALLEENGKVTKTEVLVEKTKACKQELKHRLNNLFNRKQEK